jgi:4-hydroxy-3-polyprenylbenzoate decarboxylase
MNATMKWDYPPLSLPRQELMEKALELWRQMKLPELKLRQPWWGYTYGFWSDEEETMASLALKGRYEEVGEILARQRKPIA